jgi:hypothetical protein
MAGAYVLVGGERCMEDLDGSQLDATAVCEINSILSGEVEDI